MANAPLLSIDIKAIINNKYRSEYSLNNHMYEFELFIANNSRSIYKIPFTAVKSLIVEDSLAAWPARGSITLNYDNELAEYLSTFVFRNDGEDILRFRLLPKNDSKSGTDLGIQNKKLWELNHVFSIYDVEDVSPQSRGNSDADAVSRLKRFSFWDIRYQIMLMRNIEYSTAFSNYAGINSGQFANSYEQYKDSNRAIETHHAIEEIIKKTFNDDSILAATAKDKGTGDWDTGATKIFYTSPTRDNSYEDLMYVYNRHVSSEIGASLGSHDMAILGIERDNDGGIGCFSLESLTKIFDKAGVNDPGPYQIEHFFLRSDIQQFNPTAARTYRAPMLQDGTGRPINNMSVDIKINDFNTIDKYEFVDISPVTNTLAYTTTPVHSFDFINRTFSIDYNTHSLKAAEDTFTTNYISKLHKQKGSSNENFLLKTDTPTKLSNSNIAPTFSLYGDNLLEGITTTIDRNPEGFHRLLKTGLFQNTAINFTVPGLTIRQAGKFIAIDRVNGSEDSTLDDKLCGQWFVINVMHSFAGGVYYNNITAVKIHRYKPYSWKFSLTGPAPSLEDGPPQIGRNAGTPELPPSLKSLTPQPSLPSISLDRPITFQ